MRSFSRTWLNLTHLALLAGCSGQLPLEVPDRAPLPVEFAGTGAAGVAGGGAWAGSAAGAILVPPRGQLPSVCGDGVIDPPESCDRSNLNGATCGSLGYAGGVLTCNPTVCNYDTIMCRMGPPQWGQGPTPPSISGADAGTDDAG